MHHHVCSWILLGAVAALSGCGARTTLSDGGSDARLADRASAPDRGGKDLLVSHDRVGGCADGVKNGTETDVDCGGACAPCTVGRQCTTTKDCKNGTCLLGSCVDPQGTACTKPLEPRVVAGQGFSGLRRQATSILMRGVGSIVADFTSGDLYGQDPYGNSASGDRILRFKADGDVSTFAAPSELITCGTSQLGRDSAGNLYIFTIGGGDANPQVIMRFATSGQWTPFSSLADLNGGGGCSNSGALGLVVNTDGSLFVGSPIAKKIFLIAADGKTRTEFAADISVVYRLDLDGAGGVIAVADGKLVHVPKGAAARTIFSPAADFGIVMTARRDPATGDILFVAGTSLLRIDLAGTKLRTVIACLPPTADITFGKATRPGASQSLYISHVGATMQSYDGDQLLELER